MKKLICLVLAAMMLLCLCACTANPVDTTTPAPTDSQHTIDGIELQTILYLVEDMTGMDIGTYCYQQQITGENISQVLGNEGFDLPFEDAIAYLPAMNTTAFVLAVFRLEEGADAQAFVDALKDKANPDRWVCVRAEEVEAVSVGRSVMFLMCNQQAAKPIRDAFLQMNEPDFQVEAHLTDRLAGLSMVKLYRELYGKYSVDNYGFLDGEDFGSADSGGEFGLSDLDPAAYTDSVMDSGYYPAQEYDGERSYLIAMFRLAPGIDAADFARQLKSTADTSSLKGEGQQYLLAWSEDVVVYFVGAGSLAWCNSMLESELAGIYRMHTEGVQP